MQGIRNLPCDNLSIGRSSVHACRSVLLQPFILMKILGGTDFSKSAEDAVEVAACLAAKSKQPLTLVHWVADWLAAPDYSAPHLLDQAANEILGEEVNRVCEQGQMVETRVLHGSASENLISVAGDDTSLIVLGATGKGAFARAILGSVAEHVAESARAPTLIVHNSMPLLSWLLNDRPLKVLCAIDVFEAENALPKNVVDLLQWGTIELVCAHFVQKDPYLLSAGNVPTPDEDEIQAMQSKVRQTFKQAGFSGPIAVKVRQSYENPAYDLMPIADNMKADLIVVGSHHKSLIQRVMHPSFSRRVMSLATTNVLCVSVVENKLSLTEKSAGDLHVQAA